MNDGQITARLIFGAVDFQNHPYKNKTGRGVMTVRAGDVENLCIQQFEDGERYEFVDALAVESAATIIVNGQEVATLVCSPSNLRYLAVGFLLSEGLIRDGRNIKEVVVGEGTVPVPINVTADAQLSPRLPAGSLELTSGCGKGSLFAGTIPKMPDRIKSNLTVSFEQVFNATRAFHRSPSVYRETGGVHGAALSNGTELLVFMEDVSRHNAVDKVLGACLFGNIPLTDRLLLTTGRISSDLVLKAARLGLPVVISKSAPTTLAVKVACDLGVTLVGFVRGKRMNVYTHPQRVTGGKRE
ncbi:MAG: formate dehydrogenase accessory sulfurtransferase FdhD [Bacillota bacterium]